MTNPVRLRLIPYNARLLDARKAKRWTQKDLSELTGLSTTLIGHIETLRLIPSPHAMDEISSALDLPVDYLFPASLMDSLRDGLFENRVAELEEKQLIRLGETRRAASLPPGRTLDETVDNAFLKERLTDVLETLPPRERQVLELRFGLKDGIKHTLEEVGKLMGNLRTGEPLSRDRIRQIEERALRRMRHPSRSRLLKDYLE